MTKKPGILKKPQLGVQAATITKVAEQIAAAESAKLLEYEVRQVPLSDILLWEDQPRTFHLKINDVIAGEIDPADPQSDAKKEELEGIVSLAMSQKEFGILNPPLAYALPGKKVQLMGGQRRTMAAIFAILHIKTKIDEDSQHVNQIVIDSQPDTARLEAERIAVKVFFRRPDQLTLEKLGVVDNVQRTELPIGDRIRWLLKFADKRVEQGADVHWRDLVETLGLSRSQAYEWLFIVQSRDDKFVQKVIEKLLVGDATFGRLLEMAKATQETREGLYNNWYGYRPAPDKLTRISLGKTSNFNAIKSLIMANIEDEFKKDFDQIDWANPKLVKKAFEDFLNYWEKAHG
ncbi:MAG: hypothetical protein ACXWM2_04170 [Parachlamydiaceae bacterium]